MNDQIRLVKTRNSGSNFIAPMNQPDDCAAWLETASGERVPILGTCSLGRSPSSTVFLAESKISRRHALVHAQEESEYWLVDLGSANGTFLNGRRVTHPIPLRDQDRIGIAQVCLIFRQPVLEVSVKVEQATSEVTAREVETRTCWLLVADIESSVKLSQSFPLDQLPMVIGNWFLRCKQIVDENDGVINKFLGDGFFAYWVEQPDTAEKVVRAVEQFKVAQDEAPPRFRVVLHHGPVSVGGAPSMGEESLLGPEVNFVFRMEKLAGSLGLPCMLSETACGRLTNFPTVREAGRYPLAGFEGQFLFYSF